MRISLYPTFLKIVLACAGLFTAACSDLSQQFPLTFGSTQIAETQIAERETQQPDRSKSDKMAQIWMRVARQAIENGHAKTAVQFAQKAVEAAPDNQEPMWILAQAYGLQGGETAARIIARNTVNTDAAAPKSDPPKQSEPKSEPKIAAIAEKLNAIAPAAGNSAPVAAKRMSKPTPKATPTKELSASTADPVIETTKPRSVKSQRPRTAQAIGKKKQIAAVSHPIRSKSPKRAVSNDGKSALYRIQLGAYLNLDDAVRGHKILTRKLPANFPRLGVFVRRGPAGNNKRVNYRLRTRDLTNRSQAISFCGAVKAGGVSCLPIRQTSKAWRYVKTDTISKKARTTGPHEKIKDHARGKVANSAPKPVAIAVSATPKNTSGSQLFRVQIAAYRDLAWAVRGQQILSKSLPGNFPRLDILKRRGTTANTARINYRVRSQGLWKKDRALALCNEVRSAGYACLLIEPVGTIWRPVLADKRVPGKRRDRRT